jgi:hypothetical protein
MEWLVSTGSKSYRRELLTTNTMPPLVPSAGREKKFVSNSGPKALLMMDGVILSVLVS